MESPLFDTRSSSDPIELLPEVVHDLEPGISESPLSFWPKHIIDVIVPCCGNENVRKPILSSFSF